MIWNEKEYLYVKIARLVTIKINLLVLFDNKHNDEIKKQVSIFKILDKIGFLHLVLSKTKAPTITAAINIANPTDIKESIKGTSHSDLFFVFFRYNRKNHIGY